MPLGNNSYNKGNSNGKKNEFYPTTYSNIRISNFDSTVDPTSISFAFWKGMLKIVITPIKKAADGGYNFDKDNSVEVYLTPTRAALFLNYLKVFRKDPNAYVNAGIAAGNSIIYVTNGAEEFEDQEQHQTRITSVLLTTRVVQTSPRTTVSQSSLIWTSSSTQSLSTLTATAVQ